jgi:hypothetical protein
MSAENSSSMACFHSVFASASCRFAGSSKDEDKPHLTVPSVYSLGLTIPLDPRVTGRDGGVAGRDGGADTERPEDPCTSLLANESAWLELLLLYPLTAQSRPAAEDPGASWTCTAAPEPRLDAGRSRLASALCWCVARDSVLDRRVRIVRRVIRRKTW